MSRSARYEKAGNLAGLNPEMRATGRSSATTGGQAFETKRIDPSGDLRVFIEPQDVSDITRGESDHFGHLGVASRNPEQSQRESEADESAWTEGAPQSPLLRRARRGTARSRGRGRGAAPPGRRQRGQRLHEGSNADASGPASRGALPLGSRR